jgi:hypothetical protein
VWREASRFARPWQWLVAQRDDALLRAEVLMYVAIRRYDGIEPSAVAEFVRRVTADSGASTPAVEQELDRWAAEGGLVPLPRETPGFEAYYLVDAGNGVVVSISLFGDRDAAVAKIQVEHALPDGEWRHGYRHIWDYVVERSEHRRAVAFRIQLELVPNGGAVGGSEP